MSDKKQSSVDWLIEEINKQKAWADPSKLEPIIQEAKAKFKDQISRAYFMGLIDGGNHNPQDYFKNTYEDETSI